MPFNSRRASILVSTLFAVGCTLPDVIVKPQPSPPSRDGGETPTGLRIRTLPNAGARAKAGAASGDAGPGGDASMQAMPALGWKPAEKLAEGIRPGIVPRAVDGDSNFSLIWSQLETSDALRSRRYRAGKGWETVTKMPDVATQPVTPRDLVVPVSLAADEPGNLTALAISVPAEVSDPPALDDFLVATNATLWASRRPSAGDWGAWAKLGTAHRTSTLQQSLGTSAVGDMLVAYWYATKNAEESGWALDIRILRAASGEWGKPLRLLNAIKPIAEAAFSASFLDSPLSIQVAFDDTDAALIAWRDLQGQVIAVDLDPKSTVVVDDTRVEGHGTKTLDETSVTHKDNPLFDAPRIAWDAGGHAFAVWQHRDESRTSLHAARYIIGTGWGDSTAIDAANGDVQQPELAVDQDGNAFVVWAQADESTTSIWYNRYDVSSGWGEAAPIEEIDPSRNAQTPVVAVDAAGHALAAWIDHNNVRASSYRGDEGWQAAQQLNPDGHPAERVSVTVSKDGRGFALWQDTPTNDRASWSALFE